MKKTVPFISLFFIFLFNNQFVQSQISQEGIPYSFSQGTKSDLSSQVPVHVMPAPDVAALRAEDEVLDQHKNIPWRFGHNIDVNIDRATDGIEELLPDGSKLWRICISSPGALSLNLLFDNFIIPPGSELFIYNNEKSELLGAFSDFNNRDDHLFATTLIRGDFITIEYYEPANAPFSGEIHLSRVTHGYRGPEEFMKGFGSSGPCNVNVACPQSAGMEDQIRSACMLVTGGSGFCSGALINNTANDGTPYVLSADHCYSTPGSVVYWFNWQSATCSNPGSSPSYNSISGATQRARNAASDFWLVELSSTPPSNYNVYYSGWNRTTDNNITGKIWGIHHPAGDIKKISWSTLGVSTTTYLQNPIPGDGTHWRITTWSDGTTTEGGSSGSPLYDPQGRIIGQLHGGYASCSSITSDWYGKLGVSWTGGGTSSTRLSNWLDPIASGVTELEGYDPNTPSVALDVQLLSIEKPLDSYCSVETIAPEVTIKNRGSSTLTSATVSYSLSGGTPVTLNWTGSLTNGQTATVSFPAITLTAGTSQTFSATADSPNGSTDENPSNNQVSKTFSVYSGFTAPFSEGFEGTEFIPACWSESYIAGTTNWIQATGGYNGNPAAAHSGTSNARFYYNSTSAVTTRLITPELDLQYLTDATLTFWHAQAAWSGDQDELRIYYKNSTSGSWTLLETYTASVTAWTQRTISLPDVSSEYYIAFEGKAKYGYGVCIDDVLITGSNTGINLSENKEPVIFPNPSDGNFSIVLPDKNFRVNHLSITDVNGRCIYQSSVSEDTTTMDINLSLPQGLYLIHLCSAENKIVKKIIILE
jgi:lysyl endopeptidase